MFNAQFRCYVFQCTQAWFKQFWKFLIQITPLNLAASRVIVLDRLIGKLSCHSLRRLDPDLSTKNTLKFYFFPLNLTLRLSTPLSIMISPKKRSVIFASPPFLESLAFGSSLNCLSLISDDEHNVSISIAQITPFHSSLHVYGLNVAEIVIYKDIVCVLLLHVVWQAFSVFIFTLSQKLFFFWHLKQVFPHAGHCTRLLCYFPLHPKHNLYPHCWMFHFAFANTRA